MWRPERWKNPCDDENIITLTTEPQLLKEVSRTFEAGADAMLEALRKTCNKHFSGFVQEEGIARFGFRVEKGLWVFIPDDKKEVK